MYMKNSQGFISFQAKKTTQGNGKHSRPKKGRKAYRGQGK